MKVLVTGGAGFIGSHVVELLLAHKHTVVVFDNLSTGKLSNLDHVKGNPGLTFVEGDITSKADLERIPACDGVVHLAAAISVIESMSNPDKYKDVNLDGSRNVYAWAKQHGARTTVSASSAAVYGAANPPLKEEDANGGLSPYAETKFGMEAIGAEFTDDTFVCHYLRFFNVYGPRQDPKSPYTGAISIFVDRAAAKQDITIFGDGEQTRDFVSVTDVARAIELTLTSDHKTPLVMNVGTGHAITINRLVKIVLDIIGPGSAVNHGPEREGEVKHSKAVNKRITAMGWTPTVKLEDGLAEVVQWSTST